MEVDNGLGRCVKKHYKKSHRNNRTKTSCFSMIVLFFWVIKESSNLHMLYKHPTFEIWIYIFQNVSPFGQ